jgi:hypothetical protein
VVNGCLLTIAVLVVTAGRLGDLAGRKRVRDSHPAGSDPAVAGEPPSGSCSATGITAAFTSERRNRARRSAPSGRRLDKSHSELSTRI